ncbi:MAG: AAA family ATPase, partial [Treponemataceae bacterium]|nr:AAA family ATPase [Treponemataceae bacterium]
MLEDIQIKDFALIDAASLDFNPGFTVLTGETGAGKSILIGALSFLLGGKGGTEVIRAGTHEARVSGTFFIEPAQKEARAWLEEHSIDLEDDRVLLRRVVKDTGKTAAWIQGCPVTRADLSEFTQYLVDIHGQHEHQSLMYPQHHRGFLDAYAGLEEDVAQFGVLYGTLVQKRKALAELDENDADRERKIDMLTFAVDEITKAKLKAGEDEELAVEESRLGQFEKLFGDMEEATGLLSSESGDAVSQLKRAGSAVNRATAADPTLAKLAERLESAFYEVSD